MTEELQVIYLLAISLGAACVFGYIAQRLKQSPIIGYLFAGYLIGPHSPGYFVDPYITDQLAVVGVTLLMFAVGLNFNWSDLLSVKKTAVPGALILSGISILAGVLYTSYLGEPLLAGVVIGMAICASSTVVIVRVLSDRSLFHTKEGHLVIGWTIVEDLISVFGLLLLPAFALTGEVTVTSKMQVAFDVFLVFIKIISLGMVVYLVGEKIMEKILKIVARTRSHELFTLAILSTTFMIAIGSSYLFGVSLALGAFIAGVIIGKTDMSYQAAANALPMRDTFAVMFFLSVGMLFNPESVIENLPLFFGVLAILLILRPLIAFMVVKIARYPTVVAMTVALAIAQIGEYSFIIAEAGSVLGILPDNGYEILIACAFVTIVLNPLLFEIFQMHGVRETRYSNVPEELSLERMGGTDDSKLPLFPRAIVVGFGPVGQAAAKEILRMGYQVTVIDQNIDAISSLKNRGVKTIFGDATQFHILEKAQIENARLLVVATPEFSVARSIVQIAQKTNPHLKMIVRSRYRASLETGSLGDIPVVCDEEASTEKILAMLKNEG